ncbi:hypothetical protein AVEN_151447-1 [Araneus ventricosus]|uniref:Uncharacterized protein n=1 Tax=Araneus ventricosus TaxID=182803 RepID=A0A4Y2NRU2_ARAVE|nr:hypothetical protein AVEN_151447-1 [Araneus ventricosus]
MYRSFQNETNSLPKLWIRNNDSESESVIPNPRNHSESNSDSRIRFRGFITNPIPRNHHKSDSADSFLLADLFLLDGIGSGSLDSFRSERLITSLAMPDVNKLATSRSFIRSEISPNVHPNMEPGVKYILEAGIKAECDIQLITRALVIYHNFMRCIDDVHYDPAMVAAAALHLSSKVEEKELDMDGLVFLFYQ